MNEQDLPDVIWLVSDGVKMGMASELSVVFRTNLYILILLPWSNNAKVGKQSPILKAPPYKENKNKYIIIANINLQTEFVFGMLLKKHSSFMIQKIETKNKNRCLRMFKIIKKWLFPIFWVNQLL